MSPEPEPMKFCQSMSPPIEATRYWCHLAEGHDGYHRDDLGLVLWDDSEPDLIWLRNTGLDRPRGEAHER